MGTSFTCTAIRVVETLISIILSFSFFLSVHNEKRNPGFADFWELLGRGPGGVVVGRFDIWSHWGHSVVMRRSRSDQSKKGLPRRSTLSPIHRPRRMTVGFGGSRTHHTAADWFISNGKQLTRRATRTDLVCVSVCASLWVSACVHLSNCRFPVCQTLQMAEADKRPTELM